MAYVCAARWIARDGEAEHVRELLRELIPKSRAEPGVIRYTAAESNEHAGVFELFEEYADEAAFQAHNEAEHFRRIVLDQVIPLLSHRERLVGTTIEP